MGEFRALMDMLRPDVIGVTESWGNQTIQDAELMISGYTLFRDDKLTSVGGGVVLYINTTILSTPSSVFLVSDYESSVW